MPCLSYFHHIRDVAVVEVQDGGGPGEAYAEAAQEEFFLDFSSSCRL
jgi:hypothetical protein